MRKLLFLLFIPSLVFGQVSNWQGKTEEQLANMTAGVTNIASKSYWTDNAYAQIRDLYDMTNATAITANDTTPDIGDSIHYYTANTSTTVIDSLPFTGGYRKTIYLHIADANTTTITHSAGHLDCGGVSLALQSGDVIIGYYNGTKWHLKFMFLE